MDDYLIRKSLLEQISNDPLFREKIAANPGEYSMLFNQLPPTSTFTPTQQSRYIAVDNFIEKFDELSKLSVKLEIANEKISKLEGYSLDKRTSILEHSNGVIQRNFTASFFLALLSIFVTIFLGGYTAYNNLYTINDNKSNIINDKILNITKSISTINQVLSDNNIKINK